MVSFLVSCAVLLLSDARKHVLSTPVFQGDRVEGKEQERSPLGVGPDVSLRERSLCPLMGVFGVQVGVASNRGAIHEVTLFCALSVTVQGRICNPTIHDDS